MILLDATPLDSAHRERGVGRFVAELVKALEARDDLASLDLRLLRLPSDRPAASRFPEWRPSRPFRRSGRVALRTAGLWWSLRGAPAGTVFHGTDPVALAKPPRGRLLATVHDIIPLLFPDLYLGWRHDAGTLRLAYTRWLPRALRQADAIATVSAEVGRTLRETLGLPADRLTTIHHGAPPLWGGRIPAQDLVRLEGRFGPDPFVLSVGAVEWRKDVPTALRAVGRRNAAGSPLRLIHVGRLWDSDAASLRRDAEAAGARLELAGFVDDALLSALYARATAFVFPTRAEGFGLPLLEAMAADCPVVACRTSCLPEVAGEAALWHDPGDDAQLAEALRRLQEEPGLAERMRASGRERLGSFRWEDAAEAYAGLYRKLSGG